MKCIISEHIYISDLHIRECAVLYVRIGFTYVINIHDK